ncbi:MAG: HD domain-containing phosphohydrolase [Candidatus Omnitrophota bacterium]
MKINTTRTINELVSAMAYVLDVLSENTNLYHSWRVGIFASELSKAIAPDERKNIFYSALLHDIGYLALPSNDISYYLSLGEDPIKNPTILSHPLIGAEIISSIPNLSAVAKIVLNHHEWYNGRGYPLGKQGSEISETAQILLSADHIDMVLRFEPARNINALTKIIMGWSNERISSALASKLLDVFRQNAYLLETIEQDAIIKLFEKVRSETGMIQIQDNVDAIGITCEVFSQLIDTKHPTMIGHSKRVSKYSLLIALSMNLSHDEITKIKWAGLLHDVGKLGISKKLVNKPACLSADEYELMKKHSFFTRKILETITDFGDIAFIAGSDHERYDGTGYPAGLKGEQIPMGSRIISIADAFDAMTSKRPYRKAMPYKEACKEIEKNAGSQFDSDVVKAAIPVLRNISAVFAQRLSV